MSAEKATAIVLRTVDFSETSCVVTLYTEEFGKVRALAKGARRPKSPFESALDVLALCRIVFLRKSSDALNLLTEAKLERRFRVARDGLDRLYAAYYIAELLDALTDDFDAQGELFRLADATLAALSRERPSDRPAEVDRANVDPPLVARLVLRFELVALRLLGHLPSLEDCVECGNPVDRSGRVAFGHLVGGVLCADCRSGQRAVVSLRGETLNVMQQLADPANDEAWRRVELSRATLGELRGTVHHYLSHLIGRELRTAEYIKK